MLESTILLQLIQNELDDFCLARKSEFHNISPDLVPLIDFSQDLMAGGKRFRALFAYWAWAGYLIAEQFLNTHALAWITLGGFIVGCWICGKVSEELGKQDFGGIVMDEIIAFWLVLLFIMPANIWMQLIAFTLFRFFDAAKPGPIGIIDRHFKHQENSSSPSTHTQMIWRGFGIMIDDVAAAIATIFIIFIARMIGIHLGWI